MTPPRDSVVSSGRCPPINSPSQLPIGVAPIEHADDAPFVHHRDAVADQQHLVQVVGDQQHRAPAVAGGQEGRLHVLGGVDVEAPRRVHRDERGLGDEGFAVDDQPLLVPAREDAGHRQQRRRLDARPVDQSPGELHDRRSLQHERPRQLGARGSGGARRCRERRPSGRARCRCGPRGCCRRRRRRSAAADAFVSRCPDTSTSPSSTRRRPVSTSASSDWPLPETPAIPRISPRRTARLTSAQRGQASRAARRDTLAAP